MVIATKPFFRTGGNIGSPKIDLGGCVLYAPLWHPDLAGSPFNSPGPYGIPRHICTVTGAEWRPNGRDFDGIDDKISVPDAASLRFGTGDFSIWLWAKIHATQLDTYAHLVNKEDEVATRQGYLFYIVLGTGKLYFGIGSGGSFAQATSASSVVDGNWHFLLGTKSSTAVNLYVDTLSVVTTAHTLGSTDKAGTNLAIGNSDTVADRAFRGIIGEVGIIGKTLTAIEGQNIRLNTRWRYQ